MAVSQSDIKFYLTSLEPDIAQTNKAQSVGGYISTSNVHPNTTLAADVSLYDTRLTLSSYTDLSGLTYLGINHEIIEVEAISSNSVIIKTRGVNGLRNFHANGDAVFGLSIDNLFNQKFDDDLKQYRCVAIKNENTSSTAFNVAAYIKQNVINPSSLIKIAVEYPKNDYQSGSASGGSKMSVIDDTLNGTFDNNHFTDAVLKVTGGLNANQTRIITSYDGNTGTFVLQSSLPFTISSGDSYEVAAGPAQRLPSGLVGPTFGSNRVSTLSEAKASSFISLDVDETRTNNADLLPNGVFYIWLERSLIKDSTIFTANNAVLSTNYFTA